MGRGGEGVPQESWTTYQRKAPQHLPLTLSLPHSKNSLGDKVTHVEVLECANMPSIHFFLSQP